MYDTRLIIFLAIFNIFLPTVVFAAPIHQAAKTGNLDAIKIIVAQSADKTKTINENSHDGREPVQNLVNRIQVLRTCQSRCCTSARICGATGSAARAGTAK